jgi:hypothetical protein
VHYRFEARRVCSNAAGRVGRKLDDSVHLQAQGLPHCKGMDGQQCRKARSLASGRDCETHLRMVVT